jgi:uncharacterized membrane protein YqiK
MFTKSGDLDQTEMARYRQLSALAHERPLSEVERMEFGHYGDRYSVQLARENQEKAVATAARLKAEAEAKRAAGEAADKERLMLHAVNQYFKNYLDGYALDQDAELKPYWADFVERVKAAKK